MERVEWLNSLCPRLQHLLQLQFSKEFQYDLELARQATINSREMFYSGRFGHIFPIQSPALAEVVAYSYLRHNDEWALRKMVGLYKESDKHSELLRKYNVIGIGFAYSEESDILFNSIRLR